MSIKGALILILASTVLLSACDYIVVPEEDASQMPVESRGWGAVATNVGKAGAGDLHIDITIRNDTGAWSAMQAAPRQPAVLTTSAGKTTNCDTVYIGTGGHRLAPGFQMRGFVTGKKADPKIQPIYVECKGAEAAPGSKLSFDYSFVTGEYNYYDQQANKADGKIELNLDEVAGDVKYPIAAPVEGLIQGPVVTMTAINNVALTLAAAQRTAQGLQFKWQTSNPGEYPSYVHIGIPPVIGADGILYGLYESPDIASVPVTGAGKTAEWTTEVAVPPDVKGLYILLSVESKKQRLFANYAVDISDR